MRLYLAGPMRDHLAFNFPAFHKAAAGLRALGYEVFNPAEENERQDNFDPTRDSPKALDYYMARDLPAICTSSGVAVLEGWESSQGARLEVQVAIALGKPIFSVHSLLSDCQNGKELDFTKNAKALLERGSEVAKEPVVECDLINHPSHYCIGGIEVIDVIEAWALGYRLGNVVKYVARADHKGRPIEDLEKARWYLDREIEKRGRG